MSDWSLSLVMGRQGANAGNMGHNSWGVVITKEKNMDTLVFIKRNMNDDDL